jgi:tetratricopeptide (TPR) repeat protein
MSSSHAWLDLALLEPRRREQLQRFLPVELARCLRAHQSLSAQELLAIHTHLSELLLALRAALPQWVAMLQPGQQALELDDATVLCAALGRPVVERDLLGGLSSYGVAARVMRVWGGDVLALGETALGLFQGEGHALAATCAAWDLRSALEQRASGAEEPAAALRIGMASGPLLLLGAGAARRRIPLVLGAPVEQALAAARAAQVGEAWLHPSSVRRTQGWVMLAEAAGGARLISAPASVRPSAVLQAKVAGTQEAGDLLQQIVALAPYLAPDLVSVLSSNPAGLLGAGERRQVVALSMHLTGLHWLTEGGAASATRLASTVADVLLEVVEGLGGALITAEACPGGHHLLALFGAPVAHEHDSFSAARAALDVRTRLRRAWPESMLVQRQGLSGEPGVVRVRAGLEAGAVAAGLLGIPERFRYAVTGAPADTAQALMQAARLASEELLLGEGLAERLGDLCVGEARSLPNQEGGKARARLLQDLRAGASPRQLRRLPLVGRERERRLLEAAVEALGAGRWRVLFLQGEAGVGKSRLALELAAMAGPEVRCLITEAPGGAPMSYSLFRALLRSLCGLPPEAPSTLVFRRLYSTLERLTPARSAELWPALGGLLGLPGADQGFADHDSQTQQRALAWATASLLEAAARDRPLLWICEDLQDADTASLGLLEQVLALVGEAPLLLCATHRPRRLGRDGAVHAAQRLIGATLRDMGESASSVWLDALGDLEAGRLLDMLRPALPESARAALLEQSGGNPLFLELLAEALERPAGGAGAALPPTLRQLIAAQIDLLPIEVRQLAHIAAVTAAVDRVFPHWLLERVIDRPQATEPRLAELLRARIVEQVPGPHTRHYRFRHGLIQAAIYDRLLDGERNALHRRIGLVLHYLEPEQREARLDALAYHCYEGQLHELAITYSLLAGQRARQTYANREARRAFRRALGLARRLGIFQQEAAAREGLGELHTLQGRLDPARAQFERALRLGATLDADDSQVEAQARRRRLLGLVSERAGDYAEAEAHCRNGLLLTASLAQPSSETARLYAQLAGVLWRRADYASAEQACQQGLAVLPPAPAALPERAILLQRLATIDGERGRYAEATAGLEQSLALARLSDDLVLTATVLHNLGTYLDAAGDAERALLCYQESLRLKERIGDTPGWIATTGNMGVIHMQQGDYAAALRCFEQSRELSQQHNLPGQLAQAMLNMGQLAYEQGLLDAALTSLQHARALFEKLDEPASLAHCLALLGDVALAQREAGTALDYAGRSLELARLMDSAVFEACALRVIGEAQLALDLYEQSVQSLARAWQLQEQLGDPYDRALLIAAQARLSLAQHDRPAAAARVAVALSLAHEQHIPFLISRLEALRAEMALDIAPQS